jgi:putative pyruvate formate lyase activating enzyme
VRHLLLPGHFECCFLPVLRWVKDELEEPRLALHAGYLPPRTRPAEPALARHLTESERRRALKETGAAGVELVP